MTLAIKGGLGVSQPDLNATKYATVVREVTNRARSTTVDALLMAGLSDRGGLTRQEMPLSRPFWAVP
jgi:hypothetical protein